MAILDAFTQTGNREDLIDVVTRVAVEETPLLSSIGKTKATGTLHEFMTETLDTPARNAVIEGSAFAFGTLSTRTRLGNYCQISRKTGSISDTQEAVMKAGVSSEFSHQVEKATKELARDMERSHWQGTKIAGASATTARGEGGVFYWTTTNKTSMSNVAGADVNDTAQAGGASTITLAVGGGAGSAAGDHYLITGGTGQGQYRLRTGAAAGDVVTVTEALDIVPDATSTYTHFTVPVAMTEAILNDGIQSAFDAGGRPNAIYVAGKQKRAISGFGQGIRQLNDNGKKLTNTIDIYESDFGSMQVKYDRWIPAGTAAILEEAKWRTAFLRPIKVEESARVGSSRDFAIEGEYTLESLGESANALVLGNL